MNHNISKNYLLKLDYIQRKKIPTLFSFPRIENLVVTLFVENSASVMDSNAQVQLTLLFYSILQKRPKIIVFSNSSNKKKEDAELVVIHQVSSRQQKYIENVLEYFLVRYNLETFLDNLTYKTNLIEQTTSVNIKCPLVLLAEAVDFGQQYNLAIKDLHFSITIKFNKILSKEDIVSFFYFD